MTEEPQSEPHSDTSDKKGPVKLLKPVMEKPAKPALERPSKTATKPAPTDSVTKQGSEKSSKSPPPPPPRKTYPSSSSGMTTTRSGEVVYISRKGSVSSQVSLQLVIFLKSTFNHLLADILRNLHILLFLPRVTWEDKYYFHLCIIEQQPGGN